MPRSRGAGSGLLLVLLGAWGALVPFVGPYFDWVVGSDAAWDMTAGRFWISVLAGAAVVVGGLILMTTANRASGGLGAWLAIAGGAWFVVGPTVSTLWNDGTPQVGEPLGGTTQQALEMLTYFYGLGALIIALAAFALGRVATRSVRDVERLTAEHEVVRDRDRVTDSETATERERAGRFTRDDERKGAIVDEQQPAATRTQPADRA